MKKILSVMILVTILSLTLPMLTKEASACYTVYKCMSKSSLPLNYKLYFSNPNRSLGIYLGSVAYGAMGFIPGASAPVFLPGAAIGSIEVTKGYSSYKVWLKRNPKSGKIGISETVHDKEKNYKGATKTVYKEWWGDSL